MPLSKEWSPRWLVKVQRRDLCELEWFDVNGVKCSRVFTGVQARVVQHEMDHLEGVSMFDRSHEVRINDSWLMYSRMERLLKNVPKRSLSRICRKVKGRHLLEGLFV